MNQRFHKRRILLYLFALSFLLSISLDFPANADDRTEQEESGGGFTVTADKVEGAMDLLGALTGKIDIQEGNIYGLTIAKTLQKKGDQEPFVIQIRSAGPVSVKNLKGETLGGTLPSFTGFCQPSKAGWICLENVVMTVTSQSAEGIVLPDARITSCYESECQRQAAVKHAGENMAEQIRKSQADFAALSRGLEDDLHQAQDLEKALAESSARLDEVLKAGKADELAVLLAEIEKSLTPDPREEDGGQGTEEKPPDPPIGEAENLLRALEEDHTWLKEKTEELETALTGIKERLEKAESTLAALKQTGKLSPGAQDPAGPSSGQTAEDAANGGLLGAENRWKSLKDKWASLDMQFRSFKEKWAEFDRTFTGLRERWAQIEQASEAES